jgi:hypothetical protein
VLVLDKPRRIHRRIEHDERGELDRWRNHHRERHDGERDFFQ